MRNSVTFFINGTQHDVAGQDVFQPLSTYLRQTLNLTGTKVVCAEGDCGSCTVLLGRAKNDTIDYSPVCGCIQYLYQLDARSILTIEGLKYDGRLNPVQEAMVTCQGSQCGYCTPGFVVAMCSAIDNARQISEPELKRCLVGNLCRCTGYEPILKAGMNADRAALHPITSLHNTAEIAAVLGVIENDPVTITTDTHAFSKPVTIADAAAFREKYPKSVIVSGGTDIGVQANKAVREITSVLSTAGLTDLENITIRDNQIIAGARATLTDLENITTHALPEFAKMLAYFGSPLIKNAGTIGGNIANGSPIGDTMPGLFVLNAEVELTGKSGPRRVNINNFYTAYRKNVMAPDELVTAVIIPLPAPTDILKIYKVSKRKDLDISTLMAAFWMKTAGGVIEDIRIAMGGVGPTIMRMPAAENILRGQPLSEELFRTAGFAARNEIRPLSDVRGAADYRLQLAENMLLKFHSDVAFTAAHAAAKGDN